MGRWEPGARKRLMTAALDAFLEDGFEQTTVAGIAERAGVTERTFFRHFTDKREVLFEGANLLEQHVVTAITEAPAELGPLDTIAAAYQSAGALMDREFATRRAAAITANQSLLERELLKLATLSAASADALRNRGVPEPTATVAAEIGVTLFRVAFRRWIDGPPEHGLPHHIREASAEVCGLFAAPRAPGTATGPQTSR
jgi:AcrR family transcriptional regulator